LYAKPEMLAVLDKSFVSDEFKEKYASLIHQRYAQLGLK
jgi:serine/threonine-protein kinase HipA